MNKLILFQSEMQNPRVFNDNLGVLALHKRFISDERLHDINEYLAEFIGIGDFDKLCTAVKIDEFYSEEMKEYLFNRLSKTFIFLKVYKYEHGCISFSTSPFSCNWDIGLVGLIFVSKKYVLKEYGAKIVSKKLRNFVENVLKTEVETYNNFVNNYCVGFRVEDEEGNVLDGCGGFEMYEGWENEVASYVDNDLLLLNDEELLELIKNTEIQY